MFSVIEIPIKTDTLRFLLAFHKQKSVENQNVMYTLTFLTMFCSKNEKNT